MDRLPHRVAGRIAAQQAGRIGLAFQPLAMQRSQRRPMARAGEDQLVSAAKARLKVRQHRADQDSQVGLGHRPENPYRYSLGRPAQVDIGGEVVHRRTKAAIAGRDRLADPPAHRLGSTAWWRPTPTLIVTSSRPTPAACSRRRTIGNASRTGVHRDGSSTTIATFAPGPTC